MGSPISRPSQFAIPAIAGHSEKLHCLLPITQSKSAWQPTTCLKRSSSASQLLPHLPETQAQPPAQPQMSVSVCDASINKCLKKKTRFGVQACFTGSEGPDISENLLVWGSKTQWLKEGPLQGGHPLQPHPIPSLHPSTPWPSSSTVARRSWDTSAMRQLLVEGLLPVKCCTSCTFGSERADRLVKSEAQTCPNPGRTCRVKTSWYKPWAFGGVQKETKRRFIAANLSFCQLLQLQPVALVKKKKKKKKQHVVGYQQVANQDGYVF